MAKKIAFNEEFIFYIRIDYKSVPGMIAALKDHGYEDFTNKELDDGNVISVRCTASWASHLWNIFNANK